MLIPFKLIPAKFNEGFRSIKKINYIYLKSFYTMLKKFLIVIFFILSINKITFSQSDKIYPFSTNTTHLTIWNGSEYVPFFMKGINLGVAVPGTFPGELAATKEDYTRWFKQIKEAGFNCIRLYTLHYPRFFEALQTHNSANPQNPL